LLVAGVAGNEAVDEAGGGFLEDAGGAALRVAVDGARGRVLGFGGDLGEAEGVTVGDTVVAGGVREIDGVIGGDGVEIGGEDVAALGEFALVPAAAAYPFAGLEGGDLGTDAFENVGDSGDGGIAEIDGEERVGFLEVGVGVDEAWSGSASMEVDNARAFGSGLLRGGVGTDGDDLGSTVRMWPLRRTRSWAGRVAARRKRRERMGNRLSAIRYQLSDAFG
jgi:hypothetical protein